MHIVDVNEQLIKTVELTILGKNEYCYIINPIDEKTNENQFGKKILKTGPMNFFLRPG